MPKIDADLSHIITDRACVKCSSTDSIARHHTGCERMWLKHFYALRDTPEYKKLKARYESFNPLDIKNLCGTCHRAIHDIYFVIICIEVSRSGKPAREWTWKQAQRLMQRLREACDFWLKMKSLSDAE